MKIKDMGWSRDVATAYGQAYFPYPTQGIRIGSTIPLPDGYSLTTQLGVDNIYACVDNAGMETTYNLRTLQRNHRITVGVAWTVRRHRGVNEVGSAYGKADCGTFVSGGQPNNDPVECAKCAAR